mmetsp:Transcript_46297/g.100554  ORF Transcript_46297/g.100554 Transcript_46297/m.100554 type:complete len:244 (-) Transcript_46297:394-1125(-)
MSKRSSSLHSELRASFQHSCARWMGVSPVASFLIRLSAIRRNSDLSFISSALTSARSAAKCSQFCSSPMFEGRSAAGSTLPEAIVRGSTRSFSLSPGSSYCRKLLSSCMVGMASCAPGRSVVRLPAPCAQSIACSAERPLLSPAMNPPTNESAAPITSTTSCWRRGTTSTKSFSASGSLNQNSSLRRRSASRRQRSTWPSVLVTTTQRSDGQREDRLCRALCLLHRDERLLARADEHRGVPLI